MTKEDTHYCLLFLAPITIVLHFSKWCQPSLFLLRYVRSTAIQRSATLLLLKSLLSTAPCFTLQEVDDIDIDASSIVHLLDLRKFQLVLQEEHVDADILQLCALYWLPYFAFSKRSAYHVHSCGQLYSISLHHSQVIWRPPHLQYFKVREV